MSSSISRICLLIYLCQPPDLMLITRRPRVSSICVYCRIIFADASSVCKRMLTTATWRGYGYYSHQVSTLRRTALLLGPDTTSNLFTTTVSACSACTYFRPLHLGKQTLYRYPALHFTSGDYHTTYRTYVSHEVVVRSTIEYRPP